MLRFTTDQFSVEATLLTCIQEVSGFESWSLYRLPR